jgi:hypothetical protein
VKIIFNTLARSVEESSNLMPQYLNMNGILSKNLKKTSCNFVLEKMNFTKHFMWIKATRFQFTNLFHKKQLMVIILKRCLIGVVSMMLLWHVIIMHQYLYLQERMIKKMALYNRNGLKVYFNCINLKVYSLNKAERSTM